MWSPDVLLPRWTASVNEALRVCATWVEQQFWQTQRMLSAMCWASTTAHSAGASGK